MLLFIAPLSQGCSTQSPSFLDWTAAHSKHHPLVGRIYDVKKHQFISTATLLHELPDHGITIVGEKHDHPDHHRIQATLLRLLQERAAGLAIVSEACTKAEDPILKEALSKEYFDVSSIPDKALRQHTARLSILYALYDTKTPLSCGDIARSQLMQLMKTPHDESILAEERRLLEAVPITSDAESSLATMIEESHCGALSKTMMHPFIRMHRLRDASLTTAIPGNNSLVFVGTIHARKDFGIPHYVQHRFPETPVTSIALLEVDDSRIHAADYIPETTAAETSVYDYILFTPILSIDDPCVRFSRMIHHLKMKYKKKKGREDDASRHE